MTSKYDCHPVGGISRAIASSVIVTVLIFLTRMHSSRMRTTRCNYRFSCHAPAPARIPSCHACPPLPHTHSPTHATPPRMPPYHACPPPPVDRILDTRLRKYSLATTSLRAVTNIHFLFVCFFADVPVSTSSISSTTLRFQNRCLRGFPETGRCLPFEEDIDLFSLFSQLHQSSTNHSRGDKTSFVWLPRQVVCFL